MVQLSPDHVEQQAGSSDHGEIHDEVKPPWVKAVLREVGREKVVSQEVQRSHLDGSEGVQVSLSVTLGVSEVDSICIYEPDGSGDCHKQGGGDESCPGGNRKLRLAQTPFQYLKSNWQKEGSKGDPSKETADSCAREHCEIPSASLHEVVSGIVALNLVKSGAQTFLSDLRLSFTSNFRRRSKETARSILSMELEKGRT